VRRLLLWVLTAGHGRIAVAGKLRLLRLARLRREHRRGQHAHLLTHNRRVTKQSARVEQRRPMGRATRTGTSQSMLCFLAIAER
jgi:hypothetical protein